MQSWHFTVQQELAKNLLLDVAYVGNHASGLNVLSDANQALPNQLGQNLTLQQRAAHSRASPTSKSPIDGGFGSYDGLQVKLEKRNSNGLYFLNSFTWSKAIDNAPGHLENYNGDNSRINYYNHQDRTRPLQLQPAPQRYAVRDVRSALSATAGASTSPARRWTLSWAAGPST